MSSRLFLILHVEAAVNYNPQKLCQRWWKTENSHVLDVFELLYVTVWYGQELLYGLYNWTLPVNGHN